MTTGETVVLYVRRVLAVLYGISRGLFFCSRADDGQDCGNAVVEAKPKGAGNLEAWTENRLCRGGIF